MQSTGSRSWLIQFGMLAIQDVSWNLIRNSYLYVAMYAEYVISSNVLVGFNLILIVNFL